MEIKQTPFTITNGMIEKIAEIAELTGRISAVSQLCKNPTLRRKNRIRTIYSSLAIEQNILTVEQVTAVLNGKHVLAPPKDIEEVKNAYEIYEILDKLDMYSIDDLLKAHGIMMKGLINEAGEFRSNPVGVVDSKTREVIHFGTLPQYVPELVDKLLMWLKQTDVHPLIKSCVFHYEFELIHPFSDGNGRIGRLWHTLILSKWNSLFAWLPIESMIHKRQQQYYNAINYCNNACESTAFIEFMLEAIRDTLLEAIETTYSDEQVSEQVVEQDELVEFCKEPRTRNEMQIFCGIEGRKKFNEKYLKPLLTSGKLAMTIPDKPNSKNQKYISSMK